MTKNYKKDLGNFSYFDINSLGQERISKLPYSIRIILESMLRNLDGFVVTESDVEILASWSKDSSKTKEIAFMPSRVVMQDFTGVPAIVDLASMRDYMASMGQDPRKINPLVPVDLVIDHSIQVDEYGNKTSLVVNTKREFERNKERYEFLKWGQKAFSNFRVVPPATGIVHQVNLEYLATLVHTKDGVVYPDSLVGTDSHTTMINGLGIVGWGVGGIEAEAVMLGQPIYMLPPEVVGMKLTGRLREGVTATDLVLTITQILRKHGVVEKFVEFFGDGLSHLSLADRATIANMAPEYGATIGYFPVDDETIRYMRLTGRSEELVNLVEEYYKVQGLFHTHDSPDPEYSEVLELDLSTVEPSIAGPKRPQDKIVVSQVKYQFADLLTKSIKEGGYELPMDKVGTVVDFEVDGKQTSITHGSLVIAAITSCTNTSNPSVMIASGLVAKKASDLGLQVHPYVKTSLAPGSKVVREYLSKSGLLEALEKIHFDIVGFGCTTCIGNSGPLKDPIEKAIKDGNLVAASALSGNRNFEGRVHPNVKANFLASPPLVVAYALAGKIDIDFETEALGIGTDGQPVFLKDIWPTTQEINEVISKFVTPETFKSQYASVFEGSDEWKALQSPDGDTYVWDETSTYIKNPPYFSTDLQMYDVTNSPQITNARILALFGDSITTDHISPAGDIKEAGPAGEYLKSKGIEKRDFNSFGARRGNHEVMMRGTFANVRIKNELLPGTEGGITKYFPTGETMSIFEASEKYLVSDTSLIIIAGKDYGMGSSRDWAAKGPALLGVKAVIFDSVERIHRSNLIGMGILPLQFKSGENAKSLGLTGEETFDISIPAELIPSQEIEVVTKKADGTTMKFKTLSRLDSGVEIGYYNAGGILKYVLNNLSK